MSSSSVSALAASCTTAATATPMTPAASDAGILRPTTSSHRCLRVIQVLFMLGTMDVVIFIVEFIYGQLRRCRLTLTGV